MEDSKNGQGQEPQVKRPRKKGIIVAAVVAAVVVVAGIGAWVWHEQPSFCGAVCHNVMGSYVEGYESGDASLLVTEHANAGKTCLGCHEPTIEQQVNELGVYISGDYTIPLEASGIGTREFCMTPGCHDDWDEIVASTADWSGTKTVYNPEGIYNPHDNHRGDSDCGLCHSVHGQSELYCVHCHNMEVPEGWLGFE